MYNFAYKTVLQHYTVIKIISFIAGDKIAVKYQDIGVTIITTTPPP